MSEWSAQEDGMKKLMMLAIVGTLLCASAPAFAGGKSTQKRHGGKGKHRGIGRKKR